ncbi:MAG: phosphopentomutase [Clostridia bacterium]|nr:phosphopentomutase [Clostridia bacterium]
MKRVFLIVLDSFGIGAAPDAADFGDTGANTALSIYKTGKLNIPNLISLGFGNIEGVDYIPAVSNPLASVARLAELSKGKDTTIGHWEIAGIVSQKPLPTYPNGFPQSVIEKFEQKTGYGTLCNKPYSGTEVIRDYGDEHMRTGKLIVYTSADSVFQIAAHEDKVPVDELYRVCGIARDILTGEHGVGRVIARPFTGSSGNYTRTANRRDFSLLPPKGNMNEVIKNAGLEVISVGKIKDIFAGQGITQSFPTHGNGEGMEVTSQIQNKVFSGLCFVNLVDFDMLYGHRQDALGYALAMNEFDTWLGGFMQNMKKEDVLIITADHGCDPSDNSTDHTREYVPLLVYGNRVEPKNLGTVEGFTVIRDIVCNYLQGE